MANTTNFGWETPDDTDLVKDGAAAIRTLGSAIDTSLVDLKGGTTGQVLSKASNTDMDFTWVAQDDSNAIQNAIVDAKGDLISATAADTPARLAVGTNGQVLTADSTQSTGLAWTTISSGGMTLIQEEVASALSSLSFSSISGSYKQLMLVWNGIYHSNTSTSFDLRFNNNSNQNYHTTFIGGGSTYSNANNSHNAAGSSSYPVFGTNNQSSFNVQYGDRGWFVIDNYASTTKTKTYTFYYAYTESNGTQYGLYGEGLYNSTSAITSLDIVRTGGTGSFSNGTNTSIRLYGVS